jgi:hypothetical protein
MKTYSTQSLLSSIARWPLMATAVCLLTLATPDTIAAAGVTSYTSTGYYLDVPYPGDTLAFATNNVHVRNMLSRYRVQSSDARLTGRRTSLTHGYYHPDGSGTIYGTWTGEVGTWDLSDPANPKFTATAGLWDGTWQGLWQPDGTWTVELLGRGTGGAVDGLEMSETATRGPGALDDLAIPINYTGIVGPAGALNVQVLDDFDQGNTSGWQGIVHLPSAQLIFADEQLRLRGDWRGIATPRGSPTTGFYAYRPRNWTVQDGQTIELRVDLVGVTGTATHVELYWLHELGNGYCMALDADYVLLWRYHTGGRVALHALDLVSLQRSNVVLALALTSAGDRMILTGRVLDKANQNAVLHERTVVDTPAVDPTFTAEEVQALTGFDLDVFAPDLSGTPRKNGSMVGVALWQYTDGTLDPAEATFDNLELRTYEVPLLAIDKAIRLQWPASAFPFAVEGAPTVQGPFRPVLEPVFESGGVKQVAVPASDAMQVFRLK